MSNHIGTPTTYNHIPGNDQVAAGEAREHGHATVPKIADNNDILEV